MHKANNVAKINWKKNYWFNENLEESIEEGDKIQLKEKSFKKKLFKKNHLKKKTFQWNHFKRTILKKSSEKFIKKNHPKWKTFQMKQNSLFEKEKNIPFEIHS